LYQGTTSQLAEKLIVLKGHDFSRAVNAAKSTRASAPEGCFHCFYLKTGLFPQPVQALRVVFTDSAPNLAFFRSLFSRADEPRARLF
jgi:hypothetical protein